MASRAARRKQLELIKRAIIPQAVRPELRQVLVRGDEEAVLAEGNVTNEAWDHFPDDWPRQITFTVVRPEGTELGREVMKKARVVVPEKSDTSQYTPDLSLDEHMEQHAMYVDREEVELNAMVDENKQRHNAMAEKERARNAKERRIQARLEQLDTDEKPPTFGGYRRG